MIRLFIADDEQIVIDSIKFIIEKNVESAEVVGFAKSGREAIEKVEVLKPDLVFMDIRMPGIDGIEAIKQIKERHNEIMFVIITAYEYFHYAKDAIELGVIEYLLKPVNKNKVIETVKKASNIIEKKRELMLRELELKEKINKIIPYMEGQFLYSQLFNSKATLDLPFYEDIFGMELKYGYVMIGATDGVNSNKKEENMKLSIEKQNFYEYFKTAIKNLTVCLAGPPLIDRAVVYIPVDINTDIYEIKNMSIDIAKKLIENINEKVKITYRVGIGRVYSMDNFTKSYKEADMALKMSSGELISHFDDIAIIPGGHDLYPINKEKILVDRLTAGDLHGALVTFSEIFEWMVLYYGEDVDRIKSRLIELLTVIRRNMSYYVEEGSIIENKYLIDILRIDDIWELKLSFVNNLKGIFENVSLIKEKEADGLTAKVIKYINDNYDKNITLDDAAKEINMSYHYFSKFFKDQTGKNFVDYLTDLRILKAKELLQDETISVKEICYKIGYSDPNYFSKIFKKATGVTPTDYRLNKQIQEGV